MTDTEKPKHVHRVYHHLDENDDAGFPRVTISGDHEGGWVTEVHDGRHHHIAGAPEGVTLNEALQALIDSYVKERDKVGWGDGERERVLTALDKAAEALRDDEPEADALRPSAEEDAERAAAKAKEPSA